MSVTFIQSNQVVWRQGKYLIDPDYVTGVVNTDSTQLNCDNITIINSFWIIPRIAFNGTRIIGWTSEVAENTSTPPTPDSIKTLRLKDRITQDEIWIAINNTDNVSTTSPVCYFANACNGVGGSLPVMPNVTIPFPIIEQKPETVSNYTNTFIFPFPYNPLGLQYSIPAPTFNRLPPGTPVPSGLTTPAAFVTWANSNWGSYGTWTSSGIIVTLVSQPTPPAWVSGSNYVVGNQVTNAGENYVVIENITNSTTAPGSDTAHFTATGATGTYVVTAGLRVALSTAPWCFDLTAYSSPAPVNQVRFGSGNLISVPAFELTNSNVALIPVLQPIVSSATTFGILVTHKLQVNTDLAQPALYNNGVLVVAASSGVCS